MEKAPSANDVPQRRAMPASLCIAPILPGGHEGGQRMQDKESRSESLFSVEHSQDREPFRESSPASSSAKGCSVDGSRLGARLPSSSSLVSLSALPVRYTPPERPREAWNTTLTSLCLESPLTESRRKAALTRRRRTQSHSVGKLA